MRRPVLLSLLLLAALPVPLSRPVGAAPAAAAEIRPDFRSYQRLLDRYLVVTSRKGEPLDTRFDYEQLYVDDRIWTLKSSERLTAVRADLLATPPSQLTPAHRRAWLINMHNFLVIERITLQLLVPNRQFLRVRSVDDIVMSDGRFFDGPRLELEGRSYSIGRFERELLHGDTGDPWEPRATASDPRLMFALSHGLAGESPLLPWAFHGDSLEAQLDRAVLVGTALPRIVNVRLRPARFELTNLFFEHRMDFGGLDQVPGWLSKHAARDVRRALGKLPPGSTPMYLEVDRTLNQVPRARRDEAPADSLRRSS